MLFVLYTVYCICMIRSRAREFFFFCGRREEKRRGHDLNADKYDTERSSKPQRGEGTTKHISLMLWSYNRQYFCCCGAGPKEERVMSVSCGLYAK